MEKLTIHYRLKDYLEAHQIHLQYNKLFGIAVKIVFSLLLILLISIIFPDFRKGKVDWLGVGFAIFCSVYMYYECVIVPKKKKHYFHLNRKYFAEVSFIFEKSKITEITSYYEQEISWIYKYQKTPKMLLIYFNPGGFMIIPKKYCYSKEQYENICNLVANFPQGYTEHVQSVIEL